MHGVAAKPLRSDCVVYADDAVRITLVGPDAPLVQRRRVEKIAGRANWEMRYGFGIYGAAEKGNTELEIHAFVGCRNERAVALVIFERRSHVWVARWDENAEPCDPTKVENAGPKWTVGFIWVLARYRRQGIALRLLEQASRYTRVPVSDLGWYPPLSSGGKALARRICPLQFFIGK
jgi:GNAT superfamily N-acetyltransferase